MTKTHNCKTCSEPFERKQKFQKRCIRCWLITKKGYSSCSTAECKGIVKPPFETCFDCKKDSYKPCVNHDICKKYVKKDSKYTSCYTCFQKKPKEEVASDSDDDDSKTT